MATLDELNAFNIENSEITLWTFKKQSPKDLPPKFNGHWIDTTDEMDAELRAIVTQQRDTISEAIQYSLLAENNEASVLSISADETHAGLLADQFAAELPAKKTRDVKTIFNAGFYVIKLVQGENTLFTVRKTDATWRSKSVNNIVTAFFSDAQLDVAPDDNFRIHKNIDFFGINGSLFVKNKRNFESVLNYKAAHEQDYAEMAIEDEFIAVFVGLDELTRFIGSNKIQLRRMSAIRQKGFYSDNKFMDNLRNLYKKYGLNLQFDDQGRIVPTADSCRDIIAALLDHRLHSGFSDNIYDVPDATRV